MKTAIIGGGAAGYFAAIRLKELMARMEVTIFEHHGNVLAKVRASGGGRCNCTNTFEGVTDLQRVYPRGHRLLKKLFKEFSPEDTRMWFERHGVDLKFEADNRVFPVSDTSETIIDCLMDETHRLGVEVRRGVTVSDLDELFATFDNVLVCTGGAVHADKLAWLRLTPDEIVEPVPSLFTFSIADANLHELMGAQVEDATLSLPGTTLKSRGGVLITHWGVSGPAVLRLSSYGARLLAEKNYRAPLSINWLSMKDDEAAALLQKSAADHRLKMVGNCRPEAIPQRVWDYIVARALGENASRRWADLSKKEMNRLVNTLVNDTYDMAGRAPFKDEFVTCGGVSLNAINSKTLESKRIPNLYFAGEVLDIDGVTGGFNLQTAWTTAAVAAKSIADKYGSSL